MHSIRPLETLYLLLAVAGTVLPLAAFLPWLAENGLDIPLFIQDLFASRIGAFFGWDVIVSAVVVLVAAIAFRSQLSRRELLGIVAGTLIVGVSLGLPLLMFHVERGRTRALPPRGSAEDSRAMP